MVRRLRTRFSVAALRGGEDPEDAEEIQREIQCIGELILALGGKESSSQEKVWSSPSDVPVEAVGPRSPGLPQPATASGLGVGLDRGGLHTAEVAGGPSAARDLGATDGDSPLRAKLAALEMEIEALKRGSDGGGSQTGSQNPAGDFAAALAAQTEALKEALAQRGGQSSITTVKTDLTWPTLTDDKSDARDVVLFYEEFEDVCALANNCRGMSARENLLALRGRCRGSRMKTYTNAYRAAWKSGEVLSDPQAVYDRIKNKHLMFGESREEREVRVDGEHASLAKGKLTGHQFEPLFEASIADLEAVGLGKTPRELYLSYLRKMPPYLQKEIRGEEPLELSPGDGVLVPVVRESGVSAEGSLSEVVLPVECGVEAVPGLWPTGEGKGFVLLAAQECDHSLQPGEVVAEVRSGLVSTAACGCGAIETVFESEPSPQTCADCGVAVASVDHDPCFACGSASRAAARSFQGCSSCARSFGRLRTGARIGVLSVLAAVTVLASVWGGSGPVGRPVEQPGVLTCLDHLPSVDNWWEAPGGYASVWGRRPAQKDLGTLAVEKAPYETCLLQRAGEAWRLWDTRDLRVAGSVACSDEVPVTERLAVFRTRKGPRWAGWREGSATAGRGASDAVRPADAVDTARCPSYHIVESWDIDKMIEEPPTDYYYEQLAADMRARHPKACPHLLDHLVSLEGFLDKSILFGFSFGISKAEVCVSKGKLLGHNIGRDGSSPDEERCQAVIDFPPLWEKLHIQQFLGCANWLRGYLPVEYGHAAKILGQWQKPGAVFPEGGLGSAATEGCKAVKAIKRMMQNRINLATFDEASAADGSCPLEQIADASGIAVGGSVVQMTRDLSQLKVLMTHSKSLTPAQQNWPPLIQEAFAQLEVKRATRRMFGSIRTLCWTDHANLTRAQTSDIGMDPKLVRWVAEILMDGSEIRSLSGRSATLGDSFSRNPKDRDALLAARTKDLEGLSGQLRGFDLDQYLGEGTEGDGPVPWAVGNDAVPEPAGRVQAAAVPMCVVAALPVRVMVVFDYARWKEQDAELTEIRRVFQASLPGVSVAVRGCWGPFEDTDGLAAHFDCGAGRLAGTKKIKRIRVDLLTSCAKVLREASGFRPQFLVGLGQGGLVTAVLRWPLVVELTLQARNLQRKEARAVGEAWAGIKAIWAVRPRLWRTQQGHLEVAEACPELKKDFPEPPLRGFGIVGKQALGAEVLRSLRLDAVRSIDDASIRGMLDEPSRPLWDHEGLCICGKRTYLFSRCPACIEKEAVDTSVEIAEREEPEPPLEGDLEAHEVGLEVNSVLATLDRTGGLVRVRSSTIQQWAVGFRTTPKDAPVPTAYGMLSGKIWKKSHSTKLSLGSQHKDLSKWGDVKPYWTTWVVREDGAVVAGHNCSPLNVVQGDIVVHWSSVVNWHGHRHVVNEQCEVLWRSDGKEVALDPSFSKLIALVGRVTQVIGWRATGDAASDPRGSTPQASRVLAQFSSSNEGVEGHWTAGAISRGKNANECELKGRVLAFMGEEHKGPAVVLELVSHSPILCIWDHSSTKVKVEFKGGVPSLSLVAGEDENRREQLAVEARDAANISEFRVTGSLRTAWYEGQRRDPSLAGSIRKPEPPMVMSGDGLLEREVTLRTGQTVVVPVVPNGAAGANGVTWRRACYNSVHCGVLGAHRSAEVTVKLLERAVWWPDLEKDVRTWVAKCLACIKGRSRPTKVEARAVKCGAETCWQEVSVDCEGPNREDREGHRYSLTYFDCLSHAVLLEPMRSLTHAEVRRAFVRCVLRSRTIPSLIRSDRGPEFKNALMAELSAMLGTEWRFSAPLRPCELGANERVHQEVQKVLGANRRGRLVSPQLRAAGSRRRQAGGVHADQAREGLRPPPWRPHRLSGCRWRPEGVQVRTGYAGGCGPCAGRRPPLSPRRQRGSRQMAACICRRGRSAHAFRRDPSGPRSGFR